MNSTFSPFTLRKSDGEARLGTLHTGKGPIETPCFMPVATRGTIKCLPFEPLEKIGYRLILNNTYHLHLRPGEDLIQEMGGVGPWSSWRGPILTDSGGFQVFSLAKIRKIFDHGVVFNSHLDGKKIEMTPQSSITTQWKLKSDILMAFDVCPPIPSTPEEMKKALTLTALWGQISQKTLEELGKGDRLFFLINQGGLSHDYRIQSLESLMGIPSDGIAIGGLSVGESFLEREEVLKGLLPHFPRGKPRYLMGVGTPEDFFMAIEAGIDLFDCVMPTRIARHGSCYTRKGRLNLKNQILARSDQPIDDKCRGECCKRYSRSYLRHLFSVGETTAATIATLHNLHYFYDLMEEIRSHIALGEFQSFKKRSLEELKRN